MHVKMYSCEWLYLVFVYCGVWLGDEAVRGDFSYISHTFSSNTRTHAGLFGTAEKISETGIITFLFANEMQSNWTLNGDKAKTHAVSDGFSPLWASSRSMLSYVGPTLVNQAPAKT